MRPRSSRTEASARPSFFFTVPEKRPRTACGCHPVGHDLGDGYTLRPAQQPDDLGLLRLAWRGGCRVHDLGWFNPAARSASRLILLLLGGFAAGAARLLPRSAGVRRACPG